MLTGPQVDKSKELHIFENVINSSNRSCYPDVL